MTFSRRKQRVENALIVISFVIAVFLILYETRIISSIFHLFYHSSIILRWRGTGVSFDWHFVTYFSYFKSPKSASFIYLNGWVAQVVTAWTRDLGVVSSIPVGSSLEWSWPSPSSLARGSMKWVLRGFP